MSETTETPEVKSQSIEDVLKTLVDFSQVVSKSLCAIQDNINSLTGVIESHAKEIAQLRDSIKNSAKSEDEEPMHSAGAQFDDIEDSESQYAALLNKMQMRRDALKNGATECKKESAPADIAGVKETILAAAKQMASTNT